MDIFCKFVLSWWIINVFIWKTVRSLACFIELRMHEKMGKYEEIFQCFFSTSQAHPFHDIRARQTIAKTQTDEKQALF